MAAERTLDLDLPCAACDAPMRDSPDALACPACGAIAREPTAVRWEPRPPGGTAIVPRPRALARFVLVGALIVDAVAIAIAVSGRAWWAAIPFGVLGALLSYAALVGMLNARRIEIDAGRLRSSDGPLPGGPTTDLSLGELQRIGIGPIRTVLDRRGRTKLTAHPIVAHTRDGRSVPLHLELRELEHARWLVARLEASVRAARS